MSAYLRVNPRSLSDNELDELIGELSRIKSQRSVMSSVSVLNELEMKEKCEVTYEFRRVKNCWECTGLLTSGDRSISIGYTRRTKATAKKDVADKLKSRFIFGDFRHEYSDNEEDNENCEHDDSTKVGTDTEICTQENTSTSDKQVFTDPSDKVSDNPLIHLNTEITYSYPCSDDPVPEEMIREGEEKLKKFFEDNPACRLHPYNMSEWTEEQRKEFISIMIKYFDHM